MLLLLFFIAVVVVIATVYLFILSLTFFLSFHPSACSSALGMEDNHIPDQSVLSTSFQSAYYPYRGRLFSTTYSWMAATTDRNAFLQIAVGMTYHVITAVATQGYTTYKTAVVKFQLSFSVDSLQWLDYTEEGDVRVNM